MSRGFPDRPPRSEFGPTPENRYPVRNPKNEMGADIGHLLLSQVAGMGLLSWLVELIVLVNGSEQTVLSRAEAWNPEGQSTGYYTPPELVRSGAGLFTIEYPPQVPDQGGVLRDVRLRGGIAMYLDETSNVFKAVVQPTAPASNIVTVRGWQFTSPNFVPTDGLMMVLLR